MYPPPGMPMMGGSIDPYTGMPTGQPMMVPMQLMGQQQQQQQQKPGAPMSHQEVPEGMEDEPEMQAQPGFFTNERGNLKVSPCAAPSFSAPSCDTCNLRARAPHPRLCSATTTTPPSRWTCSGCSILTLHICCTVSPRLLTPFFGCSSWPWS